MVDESTGVLDSLGSRIAVEFFQRIGRPASILDAYGNILMANQAAVEYLDIDRAELPGINVRSLGWCEGEGDKLMDMVDEAMDGGEHTAVLCLDKDRNIEAELFPIHGHAGKVEAAAFTFEDITERELSRQLGMTMNEIYETIMSTRSNDDIMTTVLASSARAIKADGAGVTMPVGEAWSVRYSLGQLDSWRGKDIDARSAATLFAGANLPPKTMSVSRVSAIDLGGVRGPAIVVTVPMVVRGTPIGVLVYHFYQREPGLHPIQLDFAVKVGAALALAIDADLTNRKAMEWRDLLQGVIENSPVAIALLSLPDAMVTIANRTFFKNMQARTGLEISPGPIRDHIMAEIARTMEEGKVQEERELTIDTDDGVEHWSFSFVPMPDHRSILLLAMDVTERVEEHQRLQEMARREEDESIRLRTILNTLPVGVLEVDAKGTTLHSNPMRDVIWGGKALEPQSTEDFRKFEARWADTGMPVKKDEWPIYRAVKEDATTIGAVLDIHRLDGNLATVILSAAPVHSHEGELLGAVSVMQDITSQRQLEHEALEAKQKMELYIDILSHDVNNLNAGAIGYLDLYQSREKVTVRGRKVLDNVDKMLAEISGLIENINKLQDLERRGRTYGLMDLDAVLDDVIADYQGLPGRDVTISYLSKGPVMVLSNELVKDLFSNLLGNSVKHSSDPVFIGIKVGRTFKDGREFYRIDIEDNGPGISDEMKSKVFSRFVRGKTKVHGKGLGLYLVKKIADEFGGDVWVEDRVSGDHTKGARFVVLLPAASASAGVVVGTE